MVKQVLKIKNELKTDEEIVNDSLHTIPRVRF